MVPLSVGNSPRIALNSVDLPTPLRPTKPTRAPGTICAELLSIKSRPAIRTEMSDIESMRAFHRSGRKTQPVYERIPPARSAYAENIRKLVRGHQAALVVPPAQFIHQMLEVGRQTRRLRTKVLLQPFADGVTDRSAHLSVDVHAALGDSAIHDVSASFSFKLGVAEPSPQGGNCFPAPTDCVPSQ